MEYLILYLALLYLASANELIGHLKPLGEQRKEEGHVDVLQDIPDVKTFFNTYVLGNKPVVFKDAAKKMPAFDLWTDEYMEKEFGDIKCDVEEGKKENRSKNMYQWNYKEFLNKYKTEDIYMVNSLRGKLLNDLRLFPCLSCGGFQHVISDIIMWFSSGGTKSVIHNDHVDNINCLFSGVKELYMVDQKYEEFFNFDSPDGSHSLVDVDAVDVEKYPGLTKAPWWRAKMEAGDCLFIPFRWFHQVRSYAVDNRNMAVNVWFHHMLKMNSTDCDGNKNAGKFAPFDNIAIGNIESVRYILKLLLPDGKSMPRKELAKALKENIGGRIDRRTLIDIIRLLDPNKDKTITLEEINSLSKKDLQVFRHVFPGTSGDEEEEPEEESEEETEEEGAMEEHAGVKEEL